MCARMHRCAFSAGRALVWACGRACVCVCGRGCVWVWVCVCVCVLPYASVPVSVSISGAQKLRNRVGRGTLRMPSRATPGGTACKASAPECSTSTVAPPALFWLVLDRHLWRATPMQRQSHSAITRSMTLPCGLSLGAGPFRGAFLRVP